MKEFKITSKESGERYTSVEIMGQAYGYRDEIHVATYSDIIALDVTNYVDYGKMEQTENATALNLDINDAKLLIQTLQEAVEKAEICERDGGDNE